MIKNSTMRAALSVAAVTLVFGGSSAMAQDSASARFSQGLYVAGAIGPHDTDNADISGGGVSVEVAQVPVPQPAPPPYGKFIVNFDEDLTDIKTEADEILRDVAATAAIQTGAPVDIIVTGHADRYGSTIDNQGLSERRALAVKAHLELLGIDPATVATFALGETFPLVPTPDGVREPQNRRVELILRRSETPAAEASAPQTARGGQAPAPQPPSGQDLESQPAPAAAPRNFNVFFDLDRSGITAEAEAVLRDAAAAAQNRVPLRIIVTGHADRSGSAGYNTKLSNRRALAVKTQLRRLGVDPSAIVTFARGETDPLVLTRDGMHAPQNRRVELIIQ